MKFEFQIKKYFWRLALALVFLPVSVLAADFRIEGANFPVRPGDVLTAALTLGSRGEKINALEGEIIFPPDLLELQSAADGNSIVNFWIEKPKQSAPGRLSFSGIIPGGWSGARGIILTMAFRAKRPGTGRLAVQNVRALLNNGVGTPAKVYVTNLAFAVSAAAPAPVAAGLPDRRPPEMFRPEVARDANLFDGRWFAVFAAEDKSSGISRYEIKEYRQRTLSWFENWSEALSPHLLNDQELRSYISVKAIDNAGNERVATLAPRNPLPAFETYEFWIIIVAMALIVFTA